MCNSTIARTGGSHLEEPVVPPKRGETQAFSMVRRTPLAFDATVAAGSIDNLNQLLADTLTLRDLYKKHHWQASGPTFYIIHLLFDKHFEEQSKLVDLLAERVQTLGGVTIAMAPDVAEATLIPRAPKDREDTAAQVARLLQAHEIILEEARAMARDSLAALNGAFQGILITAAVAGLLRLFHRTNAATRHAVWLASLALVALIMPAHYWLSYHVAGMDVPQASSYPQAPSPNFSGPDNSHQAASDLPANQVPAETSAVANDFVIPELALFNDPAAAYSTDPKPTPVPVAAPPQSLPVPEGFEPPPSEAPTPALGRTHPAGTSFAARVRSILADLPGILLRPAPWSLESDLSLPLLLSILFLWGTIGSARLIVLAVRIRQLRRLREGSVCPGPELSRLFQQLRLAARVRRSVELRLSAEQRCPVVLGFLNPAILLPVEMARDLAESRQVLCHELAHVRRFDDWANLLQHFVQALLFFHPAVWWIGKHLSLEREIACDDHVLQEGTGRKGYALMLTSIASRIHRQAPLLAPGVSNTHSQLEQRISMILNTRRNSSPRLATGRLTSIIAATALLAVLALYAAPRVVLADPAQPAPAIAGSESSADALAAPAVPGEPAPEIPVAAEDDPPTPPVAAIGAGPKFKPGNPGLEPSEPAEIGAANLPDAPPAPWGPPRVARVKPPKAPRTPEPPDVINDNEGSIEKRLQRLEKMVRALTEQQGVKRPRVMARSGFDMDGDRDKQKLEKLDKFKELTDRQGQMMEEQKWKEQAERQASRAAEQAQRATEQARRATKELEERLERNHQGNNAEVREAFQHQLEALRSARESLAQEMERLKRQIEKLEREQQRGQKNQPRRGQASSMKMQAQVDEASDISLNIDRPDVSVNIDQ